MTSTAQCPICRKAPNWKLVDQYRLKPQGMALCQTCGFVTYPEKAANSEAILKHYEEDYRRAPGVQNIYTSQRKNQYHGAFLGELFKKWTDEGREDLVVTDVGSAFGFFLQWVRGFFPKADIVGVELTTSFVRNAWHLFKIKSVREFDASKRYDLISSYKSLEHIPEPDVHLAQYIACLKDEGFLYLGVPIWFESMKNFGAMGFDVEGYYDPNHINTWSRQHVEGLIRACGGEVVKENRTMYDTVYLIKKSAADLQDGIDLAIDRTHAYCDPTEVEAKMAAIALAGEEFQCGRLDQAIAAWPFFPQAWINKYEMTRAQLHLIGFEEIAKVFIEPMLTACPDDPDAEMIAADLCMRYEKIEQALEHMQRANFLKPNQAQVFIRTGECYRMLSKRAKDSVTKYLYLEKAREADLLARSFDNSVYVDTTNRIMQDNARLPAPFEVEA